MQYARSNKPNMAQNVLIIGASGDIGIAIARQRVKKGDQLILHFHSNHSVITELAEEIASEQVLQIIQADLSMEEGINKLLSSLVFQVDSVIFASGKTEFGLFQDVEEKSFTELLTLHVHAPLKITKQLLPSMIRNQFGRLIFITSIWGEVGASNEVLYSTVKGAQNSFVKALAKEVGASNVTVNAVSPGFIDTKMNGSLLTAERSEIYETIPLKRAGFPHEVAEAVSFLLDRQTSFLNSHILPVTGGWMI